MADPLKPAEARQRFLAVTRGKRPPARELDLAAAKARLRAADPGIDIAPTLRLLGERRWRPALLTLVPWFLSESGRSYLAPLLLRLVEGFYLGLALLRRPASRREAATQAGQETAGD